MSVKEVVERSLLDLEFHRVLDRLASLAKSVLGKEACRVLVNQGSLAAVTSCLRDTTQMSVLVAADGGPPLGAVDDVRGLLARASKDAALEPKELLSIADVMRTGWMVRQYLVGKETMAKALAERGVGLPDLRAVYEDLYACFGAEEGVRAEASDVLRSLRERRERLHVRIRGELADMLRSLDVRPHLQDDYVTLREDRFVLPVRTGEKLEVPGIIHGNSRTGHTLFVEPQNVVPLNNELKLLEQEIAEEEHRILLLHSGVVAEEKSEIVDTLERLAAVDCIAAKARLSIAMDATAPELTEERTLALRGARSPLLLLRGVPVVGNDISIGPDFQVLVVTGPNAGGKTVTLNTTGLCVLMANAGLHIPAAEDSVVPVVRHVLTVMGDNQDIQEDLSTFSGHVSRLAGVLATLTPERPALVLLDEIAVGTEPVQGACLAVAILETIADRQAMALVTTHYERLKVLSFEDGRFQNAAVGLDGETHEPDFRLAMGSAGSSSPIGIARRMGIEEAILKRADALSGGRALQLETALTGLQEEQALLADERAECDRQRIEYEAEQRRLRSVRVRLERQGQQMVLEAQRDALKAAEEAKKAIGHVVAELQTDTTSKGASERRIVVRNIEKRLKDDIDEAQAGLANETHGASRQPLSVETLREGSVVFVHSLGRSGVVTEIRADSVMVDVGALRSAVPVTDLFEPDAPTPKTPRARPPATFKSDGEEMMEDDSPPRVADNTCDLRGHTLDEAVEATERFLDNALLVGRKAVFLLHGHGTGKLKAGLRAWLPTSRYVRRIQAAEREQGGDGVTVVWLQ